MRPELADGLIAALATPLGQSALAVIRCSGPNCVQALLPAFSRPAALRGAPGHQMVYGRLQDTRGGQPIDEVMLGVYRAPRSYTGEEMVEIFAHGSPPGIERIFELLFGLGFRQAAGGEFTLRAFLNGKLDLTRAEAVQEIVSSRSRTAQSLALHRLGGAVSRLVEDCKQGLVRHMAALSIQLDYPEDEVDELVYPRGELAEIRRRLAGLAGSYRAGRLYQYGVRLALAGRTNAGKSSLFNALVREERAIVSAVHGTTRDWLEAPFSLNGLPVRLFDTAGLREVEEMIEAEGIRRTGQVIESAALVIYVIDASSPGGEAGAGGLSAEDREHLAAIRAKGIPVVLAWNKTDLPGALPPPDGLEGVPVVPLSAQSLDGVDVLLASVAGLLLEGSSAEDGQVMIDSERQHGLLLRALGSLDLVAQGLDAQASLDLVALDLQDAINALGEITGAVTSEDILDSMFSNFCVGK